METGRREFLKGTAWMLGAAAMAGCALDKAVVGAVAAGKGLGRTLGFPTLNLRPAEGLVSPPFGVYAVDTDLGRGVANWGLAPTMGDRAWREPVLEVHLLEAASGGTPASGAAFAADLLAFLRPERIFPDLDSLRAQIARDVAEAVRVNVNLAQMGLA